MKYVLQAAPEFEPQKEDSIGEVCVSGNRFVTLSVFGLHACVFGIEKMEKIQGIESDEPVFAVAVGKRCIITGHPGGRLSVYMCSQKHQ